jgi:hypothetical protein
VYQLCEIIQKHCNSLSYCTMEAIPSCTNRLILMLVSATMMIITIIDVTNGQLNDVNSESDEELERDDGKCEPGLFIPVWIPQSNLTILDRLSRGLVCFSGFIFILIGIFIFSYKSMASVLQMTHNSKYWNPTVANLTLVATVCSAPEIYLCLLELVPGKAFSSGDFGPSVILGATAFNLFISTTVCQYYSPHRIVLEKRFILLITSALCAVECFWMVLILKLFSPGVIEIWEGSVTLIFFSIPTFLIAYYLSKKYQQREREQVLELSEKIRDLRIEDAHELRKNVRRIILEKGKPKSQAFYRMQATSGLMGGQDLIQLEDLQPTNPQELEQVTLICRNIQGMNIELDSEQNAVIIEFENS